MLEAIAGRRLVERSYAAALADGYRWHEFGDSHLLLPLMHAIRLHEFGPAENLRYEEVEDPEPGPGQVRIAVAAAGVHLIDTTIRAGVPMGPMPLPELPAIPGREVAGVGRRGRRRASTSAWLGRRVVAHLGPASRGYAELAVREVEHLHALPDGVADDVAVAMIGTGRTAMAILDVARIDAGDVVLVTAAAGGLGACSCRPRTTPARPWSAPPGPGKVERVRALGADVASTTRAPAGPTASAEVTVALDGVGGEAGRAALELLARGGRHVVFGWSAGG